MKKRLEDDLREELRNLERQAEAIRTLLGVDQIELFPAAPPAPPARVVVLPERSNGTVTGHADALRNCSVRQAIEYALKHNSDPLSPSEIRLWLMDNGFDYGSKKKTKLADRIRGEIYSMVNSKSLPKADALGKYRLADR